MHDYNLPVAPPGKNPCMMALEVVKVQRLFPEEPNGAGQKFEAQRSQKKTKTASGAGRDAFPLEQKSLQTVLQLVDHACACHGFVKQPLRLKIHMHSPLDGGFISPSNCALRGVLESSSGLKALIELASIDAVPLDGTGLPLGQVGTC
eukprot:s1430_g3.t1